VQREKLRVSSTFCPLIGPVECPPLYLPLSSHRSSSAVQRHAAHEGHEQEQANYMSLRDDYEVKAVRPQMSAQPKGSSARTPQDTDR
jgi:hypothetical protein